MPLRSDALRWFSSHHGETKNKTFTSKYYTPDESWSKTAVWWFVIPESALDKSKYSHVNLLCESNTEKNSFHFLKIPVEFMLANEKKFDTTSDKVSIYLSADPRTLFVEERGKGRVSFKEFNITSNSI